MKKSLGQQLNMLFIYTFFGLGIGAIITMTLTLSKIIPDTGMTVLYIVLPITLIFVGYKVSTRFTSMTFNETNIEVKELFKPSVTYVLSQTECKTGIKYYRMYGATISVLFVLSVKDHATNKTKKYKTVLYDEKELKKLWIS